MINDFYLKRYPHNVRFAQYLIDSDTHVAEYFGVDGDEVGELFAQAVYNRYYTAEIGLEELEIFDIKMPRFKKIK